MKGRVTFLRWGILPLLVAIVLATLTPMSAAALEVAPSLLADTPHEAPSPETVELWKALFGGALVVTVFTLLYLALLLLYYLTVNLSLLVGNLKLTQRYGRLTQRSVSVLYPLSVLLSLLGFGKWYLLGILIAGALAKKKRQPR
ncbi:MAG: hypothetical protein IJX28_04490 [Clostridia bacterium]|nr:hypothetical protein [Clostridia bacterium]